MKSKENTIKYQNFLMHAAKARAAHKKEALLFMKFEQAKNPKSNKSASEIEDARLAHLASLIAFEDIVDKCWVLEYDFPEEMGKHFVSYAGDFFQARTSR